VDGHVRCWLGLPARPHVPPSPAQKDKRSRAPSASLRDRAVAFLRRSARHARYPCRLVSEGLLRSGGDNRLPSC
jgi:hypothetical protein